MDGNKAETQSTDIHRITDESGKHWEGILTQSTRGLHVPYPGQVSLREDKQHSTVIRVQGGSAEGGHEKGCFGKGTFSVSGCSGQLTVHLLRPLQLYMK